jgi:Ca2+/Na+ antiporter
MGQKLLIIEQNASTNQQVASQALLAIQNTLPSAVSQLTSLRQTVDAIANGK